MAEVVETEFRERGARQVSRALDQIGLSASFSGRSVFRLTTNLQSLVAGAAVVKATQQFASFSDSFTNLVNKIRVYSDSQEDAVKATDAIIELAHRNRTELDATALTYQRVALNRKRLNLSEGQAIRLTDILTKSVTLGGSTTQEAAGALRQFSQALSNDFKAAAQEINSIIEQTPGLAEAVAAGLGRRVDEIKKLATAGKLNAKIVVDALFRAGDQVDSRFASLTRTIGQGFIQVTNAFTVLFGKISETSGAGVALSKFFERISSSVLALANDSDRLTAVMQNLRTALDLIATAAVTKFLFGLTSSLTQFIGAGRALVPVTEAIILGFDTLILRTLQAYDGVIRIVRAMLLFRTSGPGITAALTAAAAAAGRLKISFGTLIGEVVRLARSTSLLGAIPLLFREITKKGGLLPLLFKFVGEDLGKIASSLFPSFAAAAVSAFGLARTAALRFAASLRTVVTTLASLSARSILTGLVSGLRSAAAAAATLATNIVRGGIANALATIRTAVLGLARAFIGLLVANPLGLLVVAGGALLAVLFGLRNETVKLGGETVTIGDLLGGAFDVAREAVTNLIAKVREVFANGAGFRKFVNDMIAGFVIMGKVTVLVFDRIVERLKSVFSGAAELVSAIPAALKAAVTPGESAGEVLGDALVRGFGKPLPDLFSGVSEIIKQEMGKDQLQGLLENIVPQSVIDKAIARARERAKAKPADKPTPKPKGDSPLGEGSGVDKQEKAVAQLIASFDKATELALAYAEAQTTLAKAVAAGTIKQSEQSAILQNLSREQFRGLALETDAAAKLTKEYNDQITALNFAAKNAGLDGTQELANAVARQTREFEKARLEIKSYQDQLSATESFTLGVQAGFDKFTASLGNVFSQVSDVTQFALDKGLSAIDEFVSTGTLDFRKFAGDVVGEIQKVITRMIALQAIRAFEKGGAGGFLGAFFGPKLGDPKATQATVPTGADSGVKSTAERLISTEAPVPVTIVPGGTGSGAGDAAAKAAAATQVQATATVEAKAEAAAQTGILSQLKDIMSNGFTSLGGFFTNTFPKLFSSLGSLFGGGGGGGIASAIGGALGSGGSGVMSLVSGIAGAFGGGGFGSLLGTALNTFGGARAAGGPVKAGQSYLTGEKGPEMFVPRETGSVVSNETLAGMGESSPTTNVTVVNVDDPSSVLNSMSTREGEQLILNTFVRNRGKMKELIG